jgi:hypothetical protein
MKHRSSGRLRSQAERRRVWCGYDELENLARISPLPVTLFLSGLVWPAVFLFVLPGFPFAVML